MWDLEDNRRLELNEPLLYQRPGNASGIGQPQNFEELRQQLSNEEIVNIKRDTYTDLMFDAILLVMIVNFGSESRCGIPILNWCFTYVLIMGFRSLNNLFKLYVARHCFRFSFRYQVASFVLIDGLYVLWLVYGNLLFFSGANDCRADEGSRVLYNLMFVILVIGYFQMLMYFLMVCCLPCALWYLRRQQRLLAGGIS